MDEVKIESKIMRRIASRFVKNALRKKLGYEVDFRLNSFRTTVLDDKTHAHLDIDLELSSEDFDKLMESIGL